MANSYVVSYDKGSGCRKWASSPQSTPDAAWDAAGGLTPGHMGARVERVTHSHSPAKLIILSCCSHFRVGEEEYDDEVAAIRAAKEAICPECGEVGHVYIHTKDG